MLGLDAELLARNVEDGPQGGGLRDVGVRPGFTVLVVPRWGG